MAPLVIDYPTLWFLVVGGLFSGYAILDGFDLGAGALHLFFNKEKSRRIALNAIGPVWDGNEVWLVIGGGARGTVVYRFCVPDLPGEGEAGGDELLIWSLELNSKL